MGAGRRSFVCFVSSPPSFSTSSATPNQIHPPAHLPIPTCLDADRSRSRAAGGAGGGAGGRGAAPRGEEEAATAANPLTAFLAANEFNRMLDLHSARGNGDVRYREELLKSSFDLNC